MITYFGPKDIIHKIISIYKLPFKAITDNLSDADIVVNIGDNSILDSKYIFQIGGSKLRRNTFLFTDDLIPYYYDLQIFLYPNCNLKCPYCPFWKMDKLPTLKNIRIFEQHFVKYFLSDRLRHVSITGGEPTLHTDILFAIINILNKFNIKNNRISISTNMTNERITNYLLENKFFVFGHNTISVNNDSILLTNDVTVNFETYVSMMTKYNIDNFKLGIVPVNNIESVKKLAMELRAININFSIKNITDRNGYYKFDDKDFINTFGRDIFLREYFADLYLLNTYFYNLPENKLYPHCTLFFSNKKVINTYIADVMTTNFWIWNRRRINGI